MSTQLNSMLRGYVEALCWTRECDPEERLSFEPRMAFSTLRACAEDCQRFLTESDPEVVQFLHGLTSQELKEAGHDLWLTRNWHGAGFWDGDWQEWGERLTAAAHSLGSAEPYLGDDGMIYILGRE